MDEPIESADEIFEEARLHRERVVSYLSSYDLCRSMKLDDFFPMDQSCIWHAGYGEEDDPELRILYKGYFLDPIHSYSYQCAGCKRLAHLSGSIHPHQPMRFIQIEAGDHEGTILRIKYDECDHHPTACWNPHQLQYRTPMAIHDVLVSYIIQSLFDDAIVHPIDPVYFSYICGRTMISVRHRAPEKLMDKEDMDAQFVWSALCTMLDALVELRPYEFIYGNVHKNSFVVVQESISGQLGPHSYHALESIQFREFSYSSLRTRENSQGVHLVPHVPEMDILIQHAETRFEKIQVDSDLFCFVGRAEDVERMRHTHVCESYNFALNVYSSLCAMMAIPLFQDTVYQHDDSRTLWESIWPHGPVQAKAVAERIKTCPKSTNLLAYLEQEDLYVEPLEDSYEDDANL